MMTAGWQASKRDLEEAINNLIESFRAKRAQVAADYRAQQGAQAGEVSQ